MPVTPFVELVVTGRKRFTRAGQRVEKVLSDLRRLPSQFEKTFKQKVA